MGFLQATRAIPENERKRLAALLAEMQNRGLKIPEEFLDKTAARWLPDDKGYFVKADGKHFNPYPKMQEFIDSTARFNLFWGSRGCGKSAAGSQKSIKKIQEGCSGAIMNPDFENFRISTWPEFREWIPWDNVVGAHRYRRNIQWQPYKPFTMAFTNGVRVICKGLKDPDSARGPNINWLWYDEVGRDETGEAFQIASAAVRIGYMPQVFATGTPNVRAPWVKKFFISKEIPEDAVEAFKDEGLDRELVADFWGTIEKNKDNLDPGFYASMLAAYPPGWLRNREIGGLFVEEGGQLGDSNWFKDKVVPAPPEFVNKRIRYWDLAATEKKVSGKKRNDPDASCSTKMSFVTDTHKFYIEDQTNDFLKWENLLAKVVDVARNDGIGVRVIVEQEPASGGKNQVAAIDLELKKQIPGHPGCEGYRPTERVEAANIWFKDAFAGDMYLIYGSWNKPFLEQLDAFPGSTHTHDDRITSVSGARINIAPLKRWRRSSFLSL